MIGFASAAIVTALAAAVPPPGNAPTATATTTMTTASATASATAPARDRRICEIYSTVGTRVRQVECHPESIWRQIHEANAESARRTRDDAGRNTADAWNGPVPR